MSDIERDENGYEFRPSTFNYSLDLERPARPLGPDGEALVRLFNHGWGQIGEAFRSLSAALDSAHTISVEFVAESALARRRDTLRREAAAALGRGDRKTHRKKLAELSRLPRRHP